MSVHLDCHFNWNFCKSICYDLIFTDCMLILEILLALVQICCLWLYFHYIFQRIRILPGSPVDPVTSVQRYARWYKMTLPRLRADDGPNFVEEGIWSDLWDDGRHCFDLYFRYEHRSEIFWKFWIEANFGILADDGLSFVSWSIAVQTSSSQLGWGIAEQLYWGYFFTACSNNPSTAKSGTLFTACLRAALHWN